MTNTLTPEARRHVALFSGASFQSVHKVKKFKKKNAAGQDVLALEGVPVFRSGTFRDSMGFQHTWEPLHMDQMVAHFDMLRNRDIFPDVPTRKGHGAFLGDPIDTLIGYHTGLRTEEFVNPADQSKQTYLLADFEILDPDAQAKVDSGLWRNLSSEVGHFVTNDEAEFWPVYMGVAYVDIPAVQGLNVKVHSSQSFSIMSENEKEAPVSGTDPVPPVEPPTVTPPVTDPAAPPVVPAEPVAPVPPAADDPVEDEPVVAPDADHGKKKGNGLHQFSLGGNLVSDPAKVQQYIAGLEGFVKETRETNRRAFVKQLESDKKITSPQVEKLTALALSLDDSQYSAWVDGYAAAPALSLLAQHGGTSSPGAEPESPEADAIQTDKDIVKHHRQGGMSDVMVKETASYKRLVAAGVTNP